MYGCRLVKISDQKKFLFFIQRSKAAPIQLIAASQNRNIYNLSLWPFHHFKTSSKMISWPFLTKLTKQIQNSSIFRRTRREGKGPSKRGHSSSFAQNHGRSPKKNSSLLPDIMVISWSSWLFCHKRR